MILAVILYFFNLTVTYSFQYWLSNFILWSYFG